MWEIHKSLVGDYRKPQYPHLIFAFYFCICNLMSETPQHCLALPSQGPSNGLHFSWVFPFISHRDPKKCFFLDCTKQYDLYSIGAKQIYTENWEIKSRRKWTPQFHIHHLFIHSAAIAFKIHSILIFLFLVKSHTRSLYRLNNTPDPPPPPQKKNSCRLGTYKCDLIWK